ncbi:MAG TPA: cation-transporting P-type ATPase [Phycisphaerae bacterium]|nr:cation-transporting P-type ATPase [Phycisphaerae bacterium]
MESLIGKHWHHLPAHEVVDLLETDLNKGLDLFAVKRRQEHFGPNAVTARKGAGPLRRFLLQFHQPLVHILLVAALITAVLKEVVDAGVIAGVVLINAIVGFIQESKAAKAIEALAKAMVTEATIIRGGRRLRVSARELVPGDIVLLQSGDKVPADIRLLESRDLQIDESILTGESVPVHKTAEILEHDTPLADRTNMAYSSCLVTYGQGTGVVVAIGDATEVGRISELIRAAPSLATPLTQKIARFSHVLMYSILVLALLTFGVGILRGESALLMFKAAVALAVGAIPEGLPAVVTITLAIGVSRMARRRAVIRKLPAVETLGSTTVICSDKTGTLTENQMTVRQIASGGIIAEVTGGGYAPEGQILAEGNAVDISSHVALRECLTAGLLCNDAILVNKEGRWSVQGDPTEAALLVAAGKGGLSRESLSQQLPRIDVVPFESEHQYMATLHDGGADSCIVYLKGAPEVVLQRCREALDSTGNRVPLDRDQVTAAAAELAGQGLRVLAFARSEQPPGTRHIAHRDLRDEMTFLGLQGMIDPPRAEAIEAVAKCRAAGIRVKMITGDHALTAAAIAKQIGIGVDSRPGDAFPQALTGPELAACSDEKLIDVADRTSVFARVSPEQKLRLVEALQARGQIVAMTGDGVNDAPALKQANIGVAMGISGTDVAKEAADMVLTDDNFASIEAAVEEGRGVFDNLTKFIAWTLPTNIGEGLIILAAVFVGTTLPILPVQILWINMTTAVLLGLMLAFEPKEPGIMARPPRNPDQPIITFDVALRMFLIAGVMLLGGFGIFKWELYRGLGEAAARTAAVNVLVLVELFYLFNCRSLTRSMLEIGLFSNRWIPVGVVSMLLLQLAFNYLPAMNRLFHSAPVDAITWFEAAAVALAGSVLVAMLKRFSRRKRGANAALASGSAS